MIKTCPPRGTVFVVTVRFLAAAMGVLLAACTAGPPPATYVLGSSPATAFGTMPQAGLPVILVKPVRLPDYLDTTDLVVRDNEQVISSRTGRWGERLSIGVTRALVADLSGRLPGMAVVATSPIERPAGQLLVDMETFAARADGHVVMIARWNITDGAGRRTLITERTALGAPVEGKDDAAVVAAMGNAVLALSGQIAAAIDASIGKGDPSAVSPAPGDALPDQKNDGDLSGL